MIILVAKSVVCEGKEDEFLAFASELAEKSSKEEGCIEYHLIRSEKEPTTFAFLEKWADQEALDRHNQSEHFMRIVPKLKELRVAPPVVDRYVIVK